MTTGILLAALSLQACAAALETDETTGRDDGSLYPDNMTLCPGSWSTVGGNCIPPPALPPPPPVVLRCPHNHPYVYLFDWNSETLSKLAIAQIDNTLDYVRDCWAGQPILLRGFADRSGSETYNVVLAQRRADVVADFLAAHGLPRELIEIEAHGEAYPLLETDNGVREPQNRRVELYLGRYRGGLGSPSVE
jgi:outer membrane protein OmpA-like peptidoglycan-associated protein